MRSYLLPGLFAYFIIMSSCSDSGRESSEQDTSEATMDSEAGEKKPLPADVLTVTKPLINGILYTRPSFESPAITSFDTSQQIHVLDTVHNIFVRARIRKDTLLMTGYVPKTILPEKE